MKLPRPIIALLGVSMLALAAGVVAGRLASRLPATPVTDTASPLSAELQLSDSQRDQMRQIWEAVRQTAHGCQQEAETLQKKRDDAVFAILTQEQKARYLQLTTECFGKVAALNDKREKAFIDAVNRTKQMLDPAQRAKYEELIKNRVGHQAGSSADDNGPEIQRQGSITMRTQTP